jgi:hypothetical protein
VDIVGGAVIAIVVIAVWQFATTRTPIHRSVASASTVVVGAAIGATLARMFQMSGIQPTLIASASLALLVAVAGTQLIRHLRARRPN